MAVNSAAAAPDTAKRLVGWLEERGRSLSSLLIVTHDHPDPDALASAWALALLAKKYCRSRVRIGYGGIVGRRENRMMLDSLGIPARPLKSSDLDAPNLALVDTQPRFKNNPISSRRRPTIIIDHHPKSSKTNAELLLIDETVGATCTMLAEALLEAGVKVPARLATAIVYGIGSETQNLGREAGKRDIAAYTSFLPKASMKALWRMANPPRPASFFQSLARGIRDAFVFRDVIGVHLRELPNADRVAQMADFLLSHEKMRWSIVTGRFDGRLHVSLRTSYANGEAGAVLKEIMGPGRGGGHKMIAGGRVDVGQAAPEAKWREAEEKIVADFLENRGIANPDERLFPFRD
jgi:nanoRNase/pAp phosphatase (c-di-AMP/oligoRNAs hydrolase)